jgi:hypothetical protein
MRQHLTLSYWASADQPVLENIETLVIDRLQPPLNIDKVREPLAPLVAARRHFRTMAVNLASTTDAQ